MRRSPLPGSCVASTGARCEVDPGPVREALCEVEQERRAFKVVIETSGLVLYTIDDATLPADITQGQYNQIWSSTPAPAAVVRCNMQADGNLVAYDNGGYPVWATGTQGFPGAFFRCQDDGNLVLISQDGVVRKHSDTYAGPR